MAGLFSGRVTTSIPFFHINIAAYFQRDMLPPPKQVFRPAPPDSPSTSLVGLEQAIPPGQSLPLLPGRSCKLDKPLPKLPKESPGTDSARRSAGEGASRSTSQQEEQRSSREMTQREREEYAEWWNQQNRKHSETSTSTQTTIREKKPSCVSIRGFLSEPSEADLYMSSTPTKANPFAQEKKRTTTFSEPKDLPDFPAAAPNGLGRWGRNEATGSGFLIYSGMPHRSLVPAPLTLSQEHMTPMNTTSRFSSSESEVDAAQSPGIRDSVRSYMRKISLRNLSGKNKGKQPATSLSSVESVDFPEGCIPPHYTGVYDIRPTVSRSSIQRGVADLEKRMRVRSMSCGSDMSDSHEFGYGRCSGESGYRYSNSNTEGNTGSEGSRSSGSRPGRGQQLAVPTSPYQKYGPKIWDPPETEKIRKKKPPKKNKGGEEGDGLRSGRESMKTKILGYAFKTKSRKNSTTALPISQEGGGPSAPKVSPLHHNQSQNQLPGQCRNRSRIQLTDPSEYVQAFYTGADQVSAFYELAKKRLGLVKRERQRQDLKRSIVVLRPMDCSVGRVRSEQWV